MIINQHYIPFNYDSRPMVFVGNTYYNQMLYNRMYDGDYGWNCQLVKVEDIENNSQQWFDDHQFMAASTNVATKRFLTERIAKFNPKYFSVMGSENKFDGVTIGCGVFIENFNTAVCNDIVIGDHVTMANYICLGHDATVGSYSHLSCYSYVNFANLGEGSCVAARSSFFGKKGRIINVAPNSNFMTGSTVTKDVATTGTYYSNRRVSSESSISYDML
jgi:UDP-3-O-[3-hydroxymyristoyl] glucosamine N-acyltransferase